MNIFEQILPLKIYLKECRLQGKSIAFVPTMGHLHAGHLTLVSEAQKQSDIVVVSIFVNPMQFNSPADLEAYPRTLTSDIALLEKSGVTALFLPSVSEIYPSGLTGQSTLVVPHLSTILEGVSRPGHFDGVSTVVAKLFNIVQPDIACFGAKDFQQLALIKKMVIEMAYGIKIVPVATVREADGLAMSSRNSRLTVAQRQQAPLLAKTMGEIVLAVRSIQKEDIDQSRVKQLIHQATERLNQSGFKVDEIFIRDADTLDALNEQSRRFVVLMAALLGDVRLIDNQVADL